MKQAFALLCALVIPAALAAQAVPMPTAAPPVRPDSVKADTLPAVTPAPDSLRPDSAVRDTSKLRIVIKWAEEDSVMKALMGRQGYTSTRYQGNIVVFNAVGRAITIVGDRAGVAREGALIVGDTIIYNDSTRIVVALGDSVVLRDPNQGSDVLSRGRIAYNVESRRGTVSNISTSVESGERWFVKGEQAAFVGDTTNAKRTAFYAKNGIITSCDDSVPDYYFKSSEIKMISKNIMVARPAVLYIADVPVMWMPFMFQDMRSGRRSGLLTPRFGVSELFRNSPTYRRHAENLGYYFAMNDYMDAAVWGDWRSGSRPSEGDPGWVKVNAEWRYRWLDRFMTGRLAASHLAQRDGSTNTAVSWDHDQAFSQKTRLTTNVNYMTNTSVQRRTTFDPLLVLATIASRANLQTGIAGIPISIGGSRTQYTGRSEVQQSFPNVSISQLSFSPVKWFDWKPALSFNNDESLNIDQAGEFAYRFIDKGNGVTDSVKLKRSNRNTTASLQSPFKIFGFDWGNTFAFRDQEFRAPATITFVDPVDTAKKTSRVFAKTFSTEVDWQTNFTLPSLLQGTLNITPSVNFQNVDSHGLFWARTEQTNGKFVHQKKRMSASLGMSPTLFALIPGFGPVAMLRHSITPSVSWSYAPATSVPKEYLRAFNVRENGYLNGLAQNQVSVTISQVFEAKLRTHDTTAGAVDEKLKILGLQFTPISYDFERARATHRSGMSTSQFSYSVTSDLLPGFSGNVGYSLYQGDITSDTAVFKPYRTDINASFTLNGQSGLLGALNRVFGHAVPDRTPQIEKLQQSADDAMASRMGSTPVAGNNPRNRLYSMPTTENWQAQLTFTSTRQRPPTGNANIIVEDPATKCQFYVANPLNYQRCIEQASLVSTGASLITRSTLGGPFIRTPPRESLQSQMSFHVTPKWAAQWGTTYDFRARQFASQRVSLQRELHDWRAIFAFTQAPNGNFAFNFAISLNAEPDLRFPYDKQTYRPQTR